MAAVCRWRQAARPLREAAACVVQGEATWRRPRGRCARRASKVLSFPARRRGLAGPYGRRDERPLRPPAQRLLRAPAELRLLALATAGTRAASGLRPPPERVQPPASGLRPPPCPVTSRCEEPRPGPASNRRKRSKPLPTAPPTQQLSTPRPPQIDAEIHPAADPAGAAVAHATPSFGCRSSTRRRDRQQHAPRHQILEVVGVASRSRSGLHPES